MAQRIRSGLFLAALALALGVFPAHVAGALDLSGGELIGAVPDGDILIDHWVNESTGVLWFTAEEPATGVKYFARFDIATGAREIVIRSTDPDLLDVLTYDEWAVSWDDRYLVFKERVHDFEQRELIRDLVSGETAELTISAQRAINFEFQTETILTHNPRLGSEDLVYGSLIVPSPLGNERAQIILRNGFFLSESSGIRETTSAGSKFIRKLNPFVPDLFGPIQSIGYEMTDTQTLVGTTQGGRYLLIEDRGDTEGIYLFDRDHDGDGVLDNSIDTIGALAADFTYDQAALVAGSAVVDLTAQIPEPFRGELIDLDVSVERDEAVLLMTSTAIRNTPCSSAFGTPPVGDLGHVAATFDLATAAITTFSKVSDLAYRACDMTVSFNGSDVVVATYSRLNSADTDDDLDFYVTDGTVVPPPPPPPVEPGVEWDVSQPPVTGFCGVRSASVSSLEPFGRCFATNGEVLGYVQGVPAVGGGLRRIVAEMTIGADRIVIGAEDCGGVWIDISGTFMEGRSLASIDSKCGFVASAPGATQQAVSPRDVDLHYVRQSSAVEELPTVLPSAGAPMGERMMFFGFADATPGAFAGVTLEQSWAESPRMASQDVRVRFADPGVDSAGPLNYIVTNTAYGDVDRSLYVDPDTTFGLRVGASAEFMGIPSDPDVVEFDVIWLMENNGSDPSLLEPGEGFDLLVAPVLQPLRMLSLGDSYAAGEGNESANDHICARSPMAYSGRVIQLELFDENPAGVLLEYEGMENRSQMILNDPNIHRRFGNGARWAFVACTGAVSRNVWNEGFTNPADPWANASDLVEPAEQDPDGSDVDEETQLVIFDRAETTISDLNAVTITMGGNDAGFVPLLSKCLEIRATVRAADARPAGPFPFPLPFLRPSGIDELRGRECEIAFGEMGGEEPLNPARLETADFLDQVLRPRMVHTYNQIRDAVGMTGSPDDPVVTVFGYPTLFQDGCALADAIGAVNVAFLADAVQQINATLEAAAAAAGFAFVEPTEFEGRSICADEPYLNGIALDVISGGDIVNIWEAWADAFVGGVELDAEKNRSIHPNRAGWFAYKQGWNRINQGPGPRTAAGLLIPTGPTSGQGGSLSTQSLQANPTVALQADPPADPFVVSEAVVTISSGTAICGVEGFVAGQTITVTVENAGPGEGEIGFIGVDGSSPVVIPLVIDAAGSGQAAIDVPDSFVGNALLLVTDPTPGIVSLAEVKPLTVHGSQDGFCGLDDSVTGSFAETSFTIPVLDNDLVDGTTLRLASLHVRDEPEFGSVEVLAGVVVYAPDPWIRAVDAFSYGVCAEDGRCTTARVTVDPTVGCTIFGGTPRIDGTPGDDVICGTPLLETIVAGGGDDIVFTGGGQDTLDMGRGGGTVNTNPGAFQLTVGPDVTIIGEGPTISVVGNDAIVAVDDEAQVVAGVAMVSPLTNDDAPLGIDAATFAIVGFPEAAVVDDISVDSGELVVTFTAIEPAGEQRFTYLICDVAGVCDYGQIVVDTDEIPPSTPPVATDDNVQLLAGDTVLVDVLANDTDLDNDIDPLSLSITTVTDGLVAEVVTVDGQPHVSVSADLTASSTQSVIYEICDLASNCVTAELAVTVIALSDCTITGTDGDDVLTGTSGDDVICGFAGDDVIRGEGGNDMIFGGRGADDIRGGGGNDIIYGGRGADDIRGGAGADELRGARGADTIRGGAGADTIRGGAGADILEGGGGGDLIFGGSGPDLLEGNNGDDELRGRRGADLLKGGAGDDVLFGGRGADELRGGSGEDLLFGRRGNDLLIGGAGFDTGNGGRGSDDCVSIEAKTSC